MLEDDLVRAVEVACVALDSRRVRRFEVCLHVDFPAVSPIGGERAVRARLGLAGLGLVLVQGLLIGHGSLAERADLEHKHKQ